MTSSVTTNHVFKSVQVTLNDSRPLRPKSIEISIVLKGKNRFGPITRKGGSKYNKQFTTKSTESVRKRRVNDWEQSEYLK